MRDYTFHPRALEEFEAEVVRYCERSDQPPLYPYRSDHQARCAPKAAQVGLNQGPAIDLIGLEFHANAGILRP